jgi:hypothetical protein
VPPTCPFFRSVAVDGALRAPIEAPDGANRCAAFGLPRPQSPLQQELVCLTADHIECPRYARGVVRVREAAARRQRARQLLRPTSLALGFLALSAAASFVFVLTRGGLLLPEGTVAGRTEPAATVVAAASEPAPTPLITSPPPAEPSPPPTAEPTPDPTPPPTPRPTATPSPSPTVPPDPRLADLEPCADQPDCYVYVVQSGDSLWAIGERFGHSLETVREWNPWTVDRGLRPGNEILLPPPA